MGLVLNRRKDMSDLRNYGLPTSDVMSTPVAKPVPEGTPLVECPNCGCKQMFEITIQVKQSLLKSATGTGTYVGCPACPFASPMFVIGNAD